LDYIILEQAEVNAKKTQMEIEKSKTANWPQRQKPPPLPLWWRCLLCRRVLRLLIQSRRMLCVQLRSGWVRTDWISKIKISLWPTSLVKVFCCAVESSPCVLFRAQGPHMEDLLCTEHASLNHMNQI